MTKRTTKQLSETIKKARLLLKTQEDELDKLKEQLEEERMCSACKLIEKQKPSAPGRGLCEEHIKFFEELEGTE